MLKVVDPIMAKRWHPRDYRKQRRSLEIYYTTGINQSTWYANQKKEDGGLRFPTIMIWLYGKPDILDPRLDSRVDDMLKSGGIKELREMRDQVTQGEVVGADSAYTRGILQAIGFKEFHSYFQGMEKEDSKVVQALFDRGVDAMKLATRQYDRHQVHWIKNKLGTAILDEHCQDNAAFYLVDATGIYYNLSRSLTSH